MKKVFLIPSLILASSMTLFGAKISKESCVKKGENYIFAGGECVQYAKANGEAEGVLNIIVHGTWKEGSDILGRYTPFAESVALRTDVTTIAVALPGYSKSSSNNLKSLANKKAPNQAGKKEYIDFLQALVEGLKRRYDAKKVNYIGHSAGCMMGATLSGTKPALIDNIVCAGGVYDIHKNNPKAKNLISAVDVIDKIDKKTKFILVYGTNDDISKPEVTKEFYELAKSKGLDVKLVEAKDAPHLDLDMTDASMGAIVEATEEE